MNYSLKEIETLKKLFDALQVFRDLDPNINILTVQTALEVARRGDNGVSVKNLEPLLKCSNAASSRNLAVLEPKSERNPKGFGLAQPILDPSDPKGKLRVPTKAMDELVKRLMHAMS